MAEILRQKAIYKEFPLINQQSAPRCNNEQWTISSIKSLHTDRLRLQFFCENDLYEQAKFQEWNRHSSVCRSTERQDDETDSDIAHDQVDFIFIINTSRNFHFSPAKSILPL